VTGLGVEICVEGVQGCRAARAAGAHRVELCAGLIEGGTTPSPGTLRRACGIGVEVVALIRPRAGDFLYTEDELETMRLDVTFARESGASGVALGALTADGEVDTQTTSELIELARPMEVCFHRAFDMTRDPRAALETLAGLGVERVLSSGHAPTAEQGAKLIGELVQLAGDRIAVMAGGGVRAHNLASIVLASGVREVHCSARSTHQSAMSHRNPSVSMGGESGPGEYERLITDSELVRAVVAAAAEISLP
jgi:copper homeostasis protein